LTTDIVFLAKEAAKVHDIFQSLFYTLVTALLLLGTAVEYFKWPIGGVPAFPNLVGRVLVASIMLHVYPEVTNVLAEVTDAIARQLGDLNQFHLVLSRMGDKLGELSWSWTSVRDMAMLVVSFLSFFLLYFSIHVADAFYIYVWTTLYVFSPILIALYVLPQTAAATSALFRSLIEVASWKIVWSVFATLLWSSALTQINAPDSQVSFLTAISFNVILAGSLLLAPFLVNALAGFGVSQMTKDVGSLAIGGMTINSGKAVALTKMSVGRAQSAGRHLVSEKKKSPPGPAGSTTKTNSQE
jgi:hypothetical protein